MAEIQTNWRKSKQNGGNPHKLAEIQTKWRKSKQNGGNPNKMAERASPLFASIFSGVLTKAF